MPEFRPTILLLPGPSPEAAWVWKTEEKGFDVNLGVHLMRDAFKGAFDMAAVLTNDTDLLEPIRIVTGELGLSVTLLAPSGKAEVSLAKTATFVRQVAPYLGPCQMPDPVMLPDGKVVRKPAGW